MINLCSIVQKLRILILCTVATGIRASVALREETEGVLSVVVNSVIFTGVASTVSLVLTSV